VNTIVVPRSIFLETKLKADFTAGNHWPLADATLYGEDLGRSDISEGVAGVVAKSLSGWDAYNVLDRLLRNSQNAQMYRYVDITSYALLANLPADVVKILPWVGVWNGPTGAMPADFWQKIGAATSTVVNSLVYFGQMIYKGLVALGTFLVNLAQAIADWGMKALGAVRDAVGVAVQKIAETLSSLFDFIQQAATALFLAVVEGFKGLVGLLIGNLLQVVVDLVRRNPSIESVLLGVPLIFGAVITGADLAARLFQALEVVEAGITVLLAVLSGGAAAVAKAAIQHVTKEAILKAFLGAVLTSAALGVAVTVWEAFDELAFSSTAGSVFKSAVGGIALAGALFDFFREKKGDPAEGVTRFSRAAGFALMGLFAELVGGDALNTVLDSMGITNPATRGLALLVLDALALASAGFGLYKLLKKFGVFDQFWSGMRKALMGIVSGVEDLTTIVGFAGVCASVAVHRS